MRGMRAEELEIKIERLEQDKKQLMNRCWVLSHGIICQFCGFKEDCVNSKLKNDEPKRKVRDRSDIFHRGR